MDELDNVESMKDSGPPSGMPAQPTLSNGLKVPMLVSPQGWKAPAGLDNYSPSSRMMHPRGTTAPIDDMQVSGLGPKEMQALHKALQEHGVMKKSDKSKSKKKAPEAEFEPFDTGTAEPENEGVLRPPTM